MNKALWTAFFIYTATLAWEDYQSGQVNALTLAAGTAVGLGFRIVALMQGESLSFILLNHGPAFIWGVLLYSLSRLSRGAVGIGDALCFCSFAFWLDTGRLFILLLLSLLLSAGTGVILILCRKKNRRDSLPLMPFLWAAVCLQLILFLFPPSSV